MRDMMGLMKQAQEMQKKIADLQAQMEQTEVEGVAGGGMVRITLTAKGEMRGINIDPSLLVADEKEIVEDLILAAHADAKAKAERTMQEKMSQLTGGLQLPPGFKLPF